VELVVDHATTREQFGRALMRFQAVQQLVATIAAESALVRAAASGAIDAVMREDVSGPRSCMAILAAASCAAHSGSVVVRNAHQVLGAIGYTQEHPLHHFTNRVLDWRSETGSTYALDTLLLQQTAGLDRTELWSLLVDTRTLG
jgi:acyl-CoA dehydrogenase